MATKAILLLAIASIAQAFVVPRRGVASSAARGGLGRASTAVRAAPAPLDDDDALAPAPLGAANAAAAGVLVSLVAWSFLGAPGELGSAADARLLQTLIDQPAPRPESINELWFAVWNCFAVVPAAIAALALPPAKRGQRLPAAPFLWGAGAFGFFALGPYFALRSARPGPLDPARDLGWASRNIFERRAGPVNVFGLALAALAVSIPFSSDLMGADLGAAARGYADLFASSRFVAVASADIAIMSAVAATLVAEDAGRRGWAGAAPALAAASLVVPVLGPSVYLALRPPLLPPQDA